MVAIGNLPKHGKLCKQVLMELYSALVTGARVCHSTILGCILYTNGVENLTDTIKVMYAPKVSLEAPVTEPSRSDTSARFKAEQVCKLGRMTAVS